MNNRTYKKGNGGRLGFGAEGGDFGSAADILRVNTKFMGSLFYSSIMRLNSPGRGGNFPPLLASQFPPFLYQLSPLQRRQFRPVVVNQ